MELPYQFLACSFSLPTITLSFHLSYDFKFCCPDYFYWVSSLVKDIEPNVQLAPCCTYTSVTTKGLVTSLPPTTATRRILFKRIAVFPMNCTDVSWISACL